MSHWAVRVRRKGAVALVLLVALVGVPVLMMTGCGGGSQTPTSQVDTARDVALRLDLLSLAVGLKAYRAATGSYPATLSPATLGSYVNPWPTNPWTDAPMQQGTDPGNFTYSLTGDGYNLVGHAANGKTIMAQ